MKLKTTLCDRPGFLHAMPLFDLFALALMLLLIGPMFLSQSGIAVNLPKSEFQMDRYGQSIVVTLTIGDGTPGIFLGRKAVTKRELIAELESLREDELMSSSIVLLKADAAIQIQTERELTELILKTGFDVALVGETGDTQIPLDPEPREVVE